MKSKKIIVAALVAVAAIALAGCSPRSSMATLYTYSDGYTHTMSGGSNWGFTSLGDFFYGIGDLFAAFYL